MRYPARAIGLGCLLWLLALTGLEALRPGFLAAYTAAEWGLVCLTLAAVAVPVSFVVWILPQLGIGRDWLAGKAVWVTPLILVGILTIIRLSSGFLGSVGATASPSVVILGMDGANWPIIDRLIGRGELPNFERLKAEGAFGVLLSDEPTLSPRVWTTIATGVEPEVHGATDFFSTQESIREPRIWEIASVEGERTIGVWEWLLTWPPARLEGFIVPGWLTRGVETQPEDLEFFQRFREPGPEYSGLGGKMRLALSSYWHGARLPTLVNAGVSTIRLARMKPEERRNRPDSTLIHAEMSSDLFLARWRQDQPAFSSLILYATVSLAHRFWIDFEPEAFEMKEAWVDKGRGWILPAAYKQGDRVLGRLMRELPEDALLMVLSDHGTKANQDSFTKYSIRAENLIEALGMEGRLAGFSVGRLLQMREIEPDSSSDIPRFVEILESATVSGEPLFTVEAGAAPFYRVSVRGNPDVEEPADIAGKQADLSKLLFRRRVSGDHTLEGILAMWGQGIRPGAALRQAVLRDVAPTALTYLGLPMSRRMSGRFLDEAFTDRARSRLRPKVVDDYSFTVRDLHGETADSPEEDVRERLRALGYLE